MDNEKNIFWEAEVERSDRGSRLDRFWAGRLVEEGVSRGKVKEWIEAGNAFVNGKAQTKGKYKLLGNETLKLVAAGWQPGGDEALPEAGELDVLYEDSCMAIIHKDAGLTTHPAPGEPDGTLVNLLLHRFPDIAPAESGMDGLRPGIVHRLDKDTSGLIAVARTEAARLKLASDFAERRVDKIYLALVHGVPPKEGNITASMGRHPTQKTKMAVVQRGGRDAHSEFYTVWTSPDKSASLVAVRIHTGRTHQIRVHMAHIGHPLLGDVVYGSAENGSWKQRSGPESELATRQMLHAFLLRINHPETGETLQFRCDPPEDFMRLLASFGRASLRIGIAGMPGCGKSTLTSALAKLGYPTFSADAAVAALYAPDGSAAELLAMRYGDRFVGEDGGVNKRVLFDAMRESETLRREVMDMVHPMVRHECEVFFAENDNAGLCFAEVPLLFESGWPEQGLVDVAVFVDCPDEMRYGILAKNRGLESDMLAVFDSWQWSADIKREKCDDTVLNVGDVAALEAEAAKLVERMQERLQARLNVHEKRIAALLNEVENLPPKEFMA